MRTRLVLIVLTTFLLACNAGNRELEQRMGELPDTDQPTVFMIFAPDCPLCANYGAEFDALSKKFEGRARFISILPGNQYTEAEVEEFLETTGLSTSIMYDMEWQFTGALEAKVTPEFFVVKDGEKKYSGKMDDWAALIGLKRREATEFYLEDALTQVLENKEVTLKHTQAVGCILEYDNVSE